MKRKGIPILGSVRIGNLWNMERKKSIGAITTEVENRKVVYVRNIGIAIQGYRIVQLYLFPIYICLTLYRVSESYGM